MSNSRRALRTCPACGAVRQSATARWCGRCGAALAAPADEADAPRPRPRWLWPVAIVGIVALLAAATVMIARERPWVTRPPDDTGVALPSEGEVTEGDTAPLACAPEPCALWRVEDVGSGRVSVGNGAVVHAGRETLTVVEAATGDVRWRGPLPGAERTDAGLPASTYVDDEIVAIAFGRDAQAPAQVLTFDADTGRPSFETTLDDVDDVPSLERAGNDLLLRATSPSGEFDRTVLMRVSLSGEGVERLSRRLTFGDTLLRQEDDVVAAHRRADGDVVWRREGVTVVDVDTVGRQVLLHGPGDEREVVDLADGGTVGTFPAGELAPAQFIGRWLGLRGDARIRVVAPDTGAEVYARDLPAHEVGRHIAHLALDSHTVVAWPMAAGAEVTVHDDTGAVVGSWLHEGAGTGEDEARDQWAGLAPVAGRPDLVQVVTSFGTTTRWQRLEDAAVVRELTAEQEEQGSPANFTRGLSWWGGVRGLQIHGPGGSVVARGVERIVSVDPVIAHGPAGLLRLDPEPLLGRSGEGGVATGEGGECRGPRRLPLESGIAFVSTLVNRPGAARAERGVLSIRPVSAPRGAPGCTSCWGNAIWTPPDPLSVARDSACVTG